MAKKKKTVKKKKIAKTRAKAKRAKIKPASKVNKTVAALESINKTVDKYDKLFEQKLAQEYSVFREKKDLKHANRRFLRIFFVLLVITLLTILVLVMFR
jgi:hypothetical protein